jgi:GTP cyclohydrolase I
MELDPKALALFREGYDKILAGLGHLGYAIDDENFVDTAARAAKGFHELVMGETFVKSEVANLLAKTFPAKYGEMVISKHNTAFGVCPHHLLPVITASGGVHPDPQGAGPVECRGSPACSPAVAPARGPHPRAALILHEQPILGLGGYIEGPHMCMAARGVSAHERRVTSASAACSSSSPPRRVHQAGHGPQTGIL